MNLTARLSNNYKNQTWPLFGLSTYLSPFWYAVSIGNSQLTTDEFSLTLVLDQTMV